MTFPCHGRVFVHFGGICRGGRGGGGRTGGKISSNSWVLAGFLPRHKHGLSDKPKSIHSILMDGRSCLFSNAVISQTPQKNVELLCLHSLINRFDEY